MGRQMKSSGTSQQSQSGYVLCCKQRKLLIHLSPNPERRIWEDDGLYFTGPERLFDRCPPPVLVYKDPLLCKPSI